MGCTQSHSEDIPRMYLLSSDEFIQSINDVPEYFNKTLQTSQDFIVSNKTKKEPEMSYNGPPSHLENSFDVHPFWYHHGHDFYQKNLNSDQPPPSLLPSVSTAQELRQIELKEAITDLRQQVIGVMAEKKSKKKVKSKNKKTEDHLLKDLSHDEKLTIEFLESVILENSDDIDGLSTTSSTSESNWAFSGNRCSRSSSRHDGERSDRLSIASEPYDNPLPGYIHGIVTDSNEGNEHVEESFLHKPVYLPDNDVLIVDADHETGANSKTQEQITRMEVRKSSVTSTISTLSGLNYAPQSATTSPTRTVPLECNLAGHQVSHKQEIANIDVKPSSSGNIDQDAASSRRNVRAMAQMYDLQVKESFGEADGKDFRKRFSGHEKRESINDIARLLMDSSNGKTKFQQMYQSEVNYVTNDRPRHGSTSDDTVSEDSVIVEHPRRAVSHGRILGQIKAELELLQHREDDDDNGMGESIDSGFVM
ncbi:uncharacterized protein LOC144364048 [Saccoglossus kowalevskii]